MSSQPATGTDTAIVLGMASTAMPFARSPEEQAERWLRLLRAHGRAGVALQALGVSEAPLEASSPAGSAPSDAPAAQTGDVVAVVTERAARVASRRGASPIGTDDVLLAVMEVYGENFDRVLRVHGTDRNEVLECLGARAPDAEPD
ncbi:MAG: hypothetical protein QOI03_2189 [Solirubrobacteraceae bacterium]|jgi:hypothetical protein|nr:hypothetical protein [Solirubrobacteraceae bacterium]